MFTGTLANALAIVVGGLIGTLLHSRFPPRIQTTVFHGLGLTTLLIGLKMAWDFENIITIVISLVAGGAVGELLRLEDRLYQLGEWVKTTARTRDGRFTEGFVAASLLFCVGAMAIVGSLDSGLRNDHSVLFTKALLDGCAALALGAAYGIGVLFSSIPLLLYQGAITLFAAQAQHAVSPLMLHQLSAVGGLLIVGIAFSLLDIKRLRLANFLPALGFIVLATWVMGR